MKIVRKIEELKSLLKSLLKNNPRVGFVPTMGYLHAGHISLVEQARKENDTVVASVFVNPTQFGPTEDLEVYPRDEAGDLAKLEAAEADIAFLPTSQEMYPSAGFATTVHVARLTEGLCGARRPVHFDGVCQIVCKLFNIVRPDNAYFGLKDYQQYRIILQMAHDLDMGVNIVGMPIVRDEEGLALSSRNSYLKKEDKKSALALVNSLKMVENVYRDKAMTAAKLIDKVTDYIARHPKTIVEYVELKDPFSLEDITTLLDPFICFLAVRVGGVRLIDNARYYWNDVDPSLKLLA